jgi:hypothetical protein
MVYLHARVSINEDTSHYVYILMHIIRFKIKPTIKVNLHNQCTYFKLKNREYIKDDAELEDHYCCHYEVDASFVTSIGNI